MSSENSQISNLSLLRSSIATSFESTQPPGLWESPKSLTCSMEILKDSNHLNVRTRVRPLSKSCDFLEKPEEESDNPRRISLVQVVTKPSPEMVARSLSPLRRKISPEAVARGRSRIFSKSSKKR